MGFGVGRKLLESHFNCRVVGHIPDMRLDIPENSNVDLGSHLNSSGEGIHKHAEDSLIMASPLEHAYRKKT